MREGGGQHTAAYPCEKQKDTVSFVKTFIY